MRRLFTLFLTLLTSSKHINKGLNSNKKPRLLSATWFIFKDFISEWQFEQTKKLLHKIFMKTANYIVLNIFCAYFLPYATNCVKFHFEWFHQSFKWQIPLCKDMNFWNGKTSGNQSLWIFYFNNSTMIQIWNEPLTMLSWETSPWKFSI